MKYGYLVLLALLTTAVVFAEPISDAPSLNIEEGTFFDGIKGLLQKDADNDIWHFIPEEPIEITKKVTVPAETPLELLPCSVLEQMISLAGEENQLHIELSALFTDYKHKNYLFSVFFLPIKNNDVEAEPTPEPDKDKTENAESASEEEDSIIPKDILKQIKENKAPDLKKFEQIAQVTGDVHLIGRAGFISKKNGHYNFSPDAFGQKINTKQFELLGNNMLAETEKEMAREPGRERYNVSGLVTVYKGKTYMLLRRASRTYTNGNFTP